MGLMGLMPSSSFLLLTILLSFSTSITTISAVNITKALEKFPDYSTMSDLFTKTGIAKDAYKYLTITVFAVDNDAIAPITAKPDVEIKNILMNHVAFDYYDDIKLKGLKEKSILITTLYQTTGLGDQFNGFLNCSKINGSIFFGSAVRGSPLKAKYVETLYHNPFNLSVIKITAPILAPGISSPLQPLPPPPVVTPAPAPAAKKEGGKTAPAPVPSGSAAATPRVAPKISPVAAPTPAPAPAPATADAHSPAPAGDEGTPAADESESTPPPSPSPSSAAGLSFGAALLLGLVASVAVF